MSFSIADAAALTEGVLWRRFWAWCLDAVLVAVVAAVLFAVLFVVGVLTLGLGFSLMAVLPLVPLGYHVLFVAGGRGATPGQAMMGLTVARERDLGPPELGQAVLFTLGLWLTFSAGVVLLGVALITERHRALHDMVSGLVVVRTDALRRVRALTPAGGFANMGAG